MSFVEEIHKGLELWSVSKGTKKAGGERSHGHGCCTPKSVRSCPWSEWLVLLQSRRRTFPFSCAMSPKTLRLSAPWEQEFLCFSSWLITSAVPSTVLAAWLALNKCLLRTEQTQGASSTTFHPCDSEIFLRRAGSEPEQTRGGSFYWEVKDSWLTGRLVCQPRWGRNWETLDGVTSWDTSEGRSFSV